MCSAIGGADVLDTVPRQCFRPPPNVDSTILRITPRQRPFAIPSEEFFRNLLDSMFLHRNRTVAQILRYSVRPAAPAAISNELPPRVRATAVRDVAPRDLALIARVLYRNGTTTTPVPDERKRRAQRVTRRR
ncbi:MAG: rRNA adenine N-6-methyltransferase family protein [Mycobacteriales bacterium]